MPHGNWQGQVLGDHRAARGQKAERPGPGPSRLSMTSSPSQNFSVHSVMRAELGYSQISLAVPVLL